MTLETSAEQGSSEEIDLFGSRDFLTGALAEQALAAMLAPGSAIRKVSSR